MALDLRPLESPYEPGSERGLLGLGFSPVAGRMFVYYTDPAAQSHLASYAMLEDGTADPASQWIVIDVPQTGVGHKGVGISFDGGVLYLALGDGGGSNSNPWGFWRDPLTGNLWMADVGNNTMEEIDRLPPGVRGGQPRPVLHRGDPGNHDGAPADAVPPVFAYRHDDVGPAAIGGRVYRGAAIPALVGAYVFGDIAGATFAISAGDVTTRLPLAIGGVVTGFGDGPDGELYALTHTEGVKQIVPGSGLGRVGQLGRP